MKLILVFVCCLLFSVTEAQRECATAPDKLMPTSSSSFGDDISQRGRDTISNEQIIIPVVVHVLYKTASENISDAQILSQIAALNQDFRLKNLDIENIPEAFRGLAADTRINFCLAKVDPNMRGTNGIIRKKTDKNYFLADDKMKFAASGGSDAWDSKRYLNIWVCKIFGRTMGYATFPGVAANVDGVVITHDVFGTTGNLRAVFNKGRTATHEIAHWLGLKHIWGDDNCGSDDVDDTPKQASYNYNCPSFPRLSSCSETSNGDMFMNFMDLTDDACMSMFTQGQKTKMRAAFSNKGFRNSFLNGFVCDSTYASGGPLPIEEEPTVIAAPKYVIEVYPNPASHTINVRTSEAGISLLGKMMYIYNLSGQLIQNHQLRKNTESINIQKLSAGIYVIQIGERNEGNRIKFVKL